MDTRADRLAAGLVALGVGPGDRVSVSSWPARSPRISPRSAW
ncbi:hypothetical protein [Micromonospora sp. NPDC003241]